MKIIKIYLVTAILFLGLDAVWLGWLAKDLYQDKLGPVINLQFNFGAAAVFYLFYIGGIIYFALYPALKAASWKLALERGVILGALCYATYDLTNMATIDGWPVSVVVADILWGMVVTGGTTVMGFMVLSRWGE